MYRDQHPMCPRCIAALEPLTLMTGQSGLYCGRCSGIWLSLRDLDDICARLAPGGASEEAIEAPCGNDTLLLCPLCKTTMWRRTRAGVAIDECGRHGVWLDRGELQCLLIELAK